MRESASFSKMETLGSVNAFFKFGTNLIYLNDRDFSYIREFQYSKDVVIF